METCCKWGWTLKQSAVVRYQQRFRRTNINLAFCCYLVLHFFNRLQFRGLSVSRMERRLFSMLYRRWRKTLHIRFAGGVCKPLHGAVIKSHGIERWGKGIIRCQVSVRELNASEPFEEVSKGTKSLTKLLASSSDRTNCNGQTAYWLQVNRHWDGRNLTQAFIGNVRNCHYDVR